MAYLSPKAHNKQKLQTSRLSVITTQQRNSVLAPVRPQLDDAMAWARTQWEAMTASAPVASRVEADEDSEEEMEERSAPRK